MRESLCLTKLAIDSVERGRSEDLKALNKNHWAGKRY